MRCSKWGTITVTKSLQLSFSCGSTGYEQFPLRSMRTRRRHMQGVVLELGVLVDATIPGHVGNATHGQHRYKKANQCC